jgi:hypothetical protein
MHVSAGGASRRDAARLGPPKRPQQPLAKQISPCQQHNYSKLDQPINECGNALLTFSIFCLLDWIFCVDGVHFDVVRFVPLFGSHSLIKLRRYPRRHVFFGQSDLADKVRFSFVKVSLIHFGLELLVQEDVQHQASLQ